MREIVLDTETTGLDPKSGDRLVEIGCVELDNHLPTGRTYHQYVNPERDMPDEAFRVHGLSEAFLAKHPVFADIADAFLEFIGDADLVIHNASFDLGFINAELQRLGRASVENRRAIDTVQIARGKYPGAQASLDALCRRFEIDLSARTKHGALLMPNCWPMSISSWLAAGSPFSSWRRSGEGPQVKPWEHEKNRPGLSGRTHRAKPKAPHTRHS